MKLLFRLLLIVAIAVAAGIFARLNSGYVQLSAPMFRFESSLNFFIIVWLLSFALFYYMIRIVRGVKQLPEWWRMRRIQKVREKMFKLQNELFFSLQRERFHDAQEKAKEILSLPEAYPLPAVIGAIAALKMRDVKAAEEFIHCDALAPLVYRVTRTLLEAELYLVKKEPLRALSLLREMREWEGLHSTALKFELQALVNAGRFKEMLPVIEQIENIRALTPAEAKFMKEAVEAQLDMGVSPELSQDQKNEVQEEALVPQQDQRSHESEENIGLVAHDQ